MLSKPLLKLIRSLDVKKFRKESNLFIAEGGKTVTDLLNSGIECKKLIATRLWLNENRTNDIKAEIIEVSNEELERASFLRTPQGVLGIFCQRNNVLDETVPQRELCLALDNIQDPGNLGTIIRIADWFGIENIYCSSNTADAYNPKTVQATMGAIGRVNIFYTDLPTFLAKVKQHAPVYGTFLNGKNIYDEEVSQNGIIVMGNEGNGISKECALEINRKLFIPNYPLERATSESLNVSTATAIICAEFRRRTAFSGKC